MLRATALVCVAAALLCVVLVALNILANHRRPMRVVNFVWVFTPLYLGVVGLWANYRLGCPVARSAADKPGAAEGVQMADQPGSSMPMGPQKYVFSHPASRTMQWLLPPPPRFQLVTGYRKRLQRIPQTFADNYFL